MSLGENPDKVKNLVLPSLPLFRGIYRSAVNGLFHKTALSSASKNQDDSTALYLQNQSPAVRLNLIEMLPLNLRSRLDTHKDRSNLGAISSAGIITALTSIVKGSSSSQSLKGLISAGFFKCALYISAKMKKRFRII